MIALNAYNQLGKNNKTVQTSMAKLSSGLRINNAADDSAGLAISQKMRAQIRGLKQAARNTQDGVSLIQTAEGALEEVHSVLQRMNELAVQSINDTNADVRDLIQQEVNHLAQEITNISNGTIFNGHKLLNGGLTDSGIRQMNIQTGSGADQNFSINIGAMDAKTLGVSGDGAPVTYGSNVNVSVTGTPSYATQPGEAIKFTYTQGTPLIPPTTAQSADIVSSKSYVSDLKTALAAGTSTTSIEKTDGANVATTVSGSPAFAQVDGETIHLAYTQGSPEIPGAAATRANLYSLKSYSSDLYTALADTSTTSIEKTDGANVATTVSGSPAFSQIGDEEIKLTYIQGSPAVLGVDGKAANVIFQIPATSDLKTALAAGSTSIVKTDGGNFVSSVTGTPAFAAVDGEAISLTYTAGIPEHLATTAKTANMVFWNNAVMDLKAALSSTSNATIRVTVNGGTTSVFTAAMMRDFNSGVGVQTGLDLAYCLQNNGVEGWWHDAPPGPNWGIHSPNKASTATVTVEVTGSSDAERAAIKSLLSMGSDSVTVYGQDNTPYTPAVDAKVEFVGNYNLLVIVVNAADTSFSGLGYFAGLNISLAPGKTLADLTGDAASTVSFDSVTTPASDAQLKITVNGETPIVLTADQMRSYGVGGGIQDGWDLFNCLWSIWEGSSTLWWDQNPDIWGITSWDQSSAATVTLDVMGSSAAERSAIRTLLGMTGDSLTVYGQDAISGTPEVDSKVMISDNHGNSQAVVVNDTDTSFSGTDFFSGLSVNLASGKSLADLTGNASSTVTFDTETTTTPSDAQLKITIDGGTPFTLTAAQMRSYNNGAGVKNGTDLYYCLRHNGLPSDNAWFDWGSNNGWGILSTNTSSAATVSVEVTGSSAAQRSAIETLLGMSGDSITLYGDDATSGTPKVDSIVTISDNHGNSQDIVVDDGDTSLTGTDYFAGLSVNLTSGKILSDLSGGAASSLSFDSVTTTTPTSDAQLKVTVNGVATTISAADMINYNSGAGVQTGDDLYQLLQSKGVNVSTSGSSDPNWKILSPNQAASATLKVDITGSSTSEKTAIRTLLGISANSVTVHGQDATPGSPAVSSKVTISDNNGHAEVVSVNDGDSSFTGTGYFSDLSVSLASGKELNDLTGNADSTLLIPGGPDTTPTNTASAAKFTDHKQIADATCTTGIDVTTQAAAASAITAINDAIDTVSTQRSKLGAYQNALDHTTNNLSTENQNLTSALSQITDLDMAEEMSNYVRNKILMDAAQAMLAQANQRPQNLLSLLM